jgi:hypothetical protein
MEDEFAVGIDFELEESSDRYDFTLQFKGPEGEILFATNTGLMDDSERKLGLNHVNVVVPGNLLNSGTVEVNLLIVKNLREVLFSVDSILSFVIVDGQKAEGQWLGKAKGYFAPKLKWTILK